MKYSSQTSHFQTQQFFVVVGERGESLIAKYCTCGNLLPSSSSMFVWISKEIAGFFP